MLDGSATSAERKNALNPAAIVPVATPPDLAEAEQRVWDELAPLGLAERTLTPSTAAAFRHLCEGIVLRETVRLRLLSTTKVDRVVPDGDGALGVEYVDVPTLETPLGLKLLTHYRGLTQRVEAGMVRFRLAPMGKALLEDPKKKDPDDNFDDLDNPAADDDGERSH
jgi:hypothetical protein